MLSSATLPPSVASLRHSSPAAKRVLLVDDDVELGQMLVEFMDDNRLEFHLVHDGIEALMLLTDNSFDLVVLDVMLPRMTGFQLLQAMRQRTTTPVIMMTARTASTDRIAGLDMGADDYVCKPVDPGELLARIRAQLRRAGIAGEPAAQDADVAVAGDIRVYAGQQRATAADVDLGLTAAELRILEILVRHAGTPVTREQLTSWALGRSLEAFDRSLDTHVSNLRRKLRQVDGADRLPEIRGLRSLGYMLTVGPAA